MRSYSKVNKTSSESLKTYEQLRTYALEVNNHNYLKLIDVTQFIVVIQLDISSLIFSAFMSPYKWQRQIQVRHLALALYEFEDDVPKVLGKDFRKLLENISAEKRHFIRLASLRSELATLLQKHHRMLKELRNLTTAHREHDSHCMLIAIEKTDIYKIVGIANSVTIWIGEALLFLTSVSLDWKRNMENNNPTHSRAINL